MLLCYVSFARCFACDVTKWFLIITPSGFTSFYSLRCIAILVARFHHRVDLLLLCKTFLLEDFLIDLRFQSSGLFHLLSLNSSTCETSFAILGILWNLSNKCNLVSLHQLQYCLSWSVLLCHTKLLKMPFGLCGYCNVSVSR